MRGFPSSRFPAIPTRRRAGLERLAAQLAAGDLAGAARTRAEDGRELPQLSAFFERLSVEGYADMIRFYRRLIENATW